MVSIGPMKLRRRRLRSRFTSHLMLGKRKSVASIDIVPTSSGGGEHKEAASRPGAPSSELMRVLRGEMTEQEYLEGRVEQALSHVKGRVSKERLEAIRQTLLMKLETDPVLLDTRARVFRREWDQDD
ncbi:MAG TPA: hypothetical protein VKP30_33315 [Polyangiaceae bacterium]|nr:hypothetical protein [Polyangiaceae bacterium]